MHKKWQILAIVLIVLGLIAFAVVMTIYGWNFSKLTDAKPVTNTHKISDAYRSICIEAENADVRIVPASDGQCTVVCNEFEKATHTVAVEDGTLTIRLKDERAWYERFGFSGAKITVSLPQEVYDSVKICLTTGNFRIEDLQCQTLTADSTTGDLTLKNVLVAGKLTADCTTGNVSFDCCDAGEISVSVTTGDVSGSLRSEKIFVANTTTGDIRVPCGTSGGACRISTTTGNIHIEIK